MNAILAVLITFLDFIIHFADEQEGFIGLWSLEGRWFIFYMNTQNVWFLQIF